MLRDLGIPFQAHNPRIREEWEGTAPPEEIAVELAVRKAQACYKNGTMVVGMDTVVVIDGSVLGKPEDATEAETMLRMLSNRTHRVITGVALLWKDRLETDIETTLVRVREIMPDEIRWYIECKEPYDKAGGYAIQGLGRVFISEIQGCYYNVVGFPLACFQRLLHRHGFRLRDLLPTDSFPKTTP